MRIVTFGEIMGRLAMPGFQRFRQALPGSLDLTFGGAEANVAASLAMLGADAEFVTALPKHAIAEACVGTLRGLGVETSHIVRGDQGRLGLYFLECGANQRPSQVVYDREGSAIGLTGEQAYDWDAIFDGAAWFHTTGITPAISETAANVVLRAARTAKSHGLTVSCDLNFRKKLWRWSPDRSPRQLAEDTMRALLPHVDVLVANEEDCADVLGITAGGTDVEAGRLEIERYPDVARQVIEQFPNIGQVAITLRESLSASHNNWGGMLYVGTARQAYFAPLDQDQRYRPYEIKNLVDRVGAGDAFAAGLIHALTADPSTAPADVVRFAVAASCLAQSTVGDFNYSTCREVEAVMKGAGSGRVVR
ncbi:MAG: PfkB family carbohydrate kinase [Planctomycetota bacterium]